MLCEKSPILISTLAKAEQRIITAQMNALVNSVFVTNENNGCWITY